MSQMHVFISVIKDVQLTKFAQACDVFEPTKIVGKIGEIKIESSLSKEIVFERIVKGLDRIDDQKYTLVALIEPCPNGQLWKRDDVQVVSDGKVFVLLSDIVQRYQNVY